MIEILIIMAAGIVLGLGLRRRPVVVRHIERAITWSIWLLLLLLGIAIGSSQAIMEGLAQLGLTALYITLGAVAGSILAAGLLWRFVFLRRH